MLGYIYCITNNITEETYIGRRNCRKEDWLKYMGSGRLVKEAIKKYGKDNFTKDLIEECDTIEDLMIKEEYWINYYKSLGKAEYNISLSGGVSSLGNYWPYVNSEEKEKIGRKLSKSLKNSEAQKRAAKKAGERARIKNEIEREKICKEYKNEVIDLYNNNYTMNNINAKLKISRRIIRKILVDNNVVKLDSNGHIIVKHTEETKERISQSIKKLAEGNKKANYCLHCGEITANKKYCSKICVHKSQTKNEITNDNHEVIEKICNLRKEGCSLINIGVEFGISHRQVKKILDKHFD